MVKVKNRLLWLSPNGFYYDKKGKKYGLDILHAERLYRKFDDLYILKTIYSFKPISISHYFKEEPYIHKYQVACDAKKILFFIHVTKFIKLIPSQFRFQAVIPTGKFKYKVIKDIPMIESPAPIVADESKMIEEAKKLNKESDSLFYENELKIFNDRLAAGNLSKEQIPVIERYIELIKTEIKNL